MDDLISRKQAIDAIVGQTICTIEEVYDRCDRDAFEDNGWLGGLKDAIEAVKEVPTAEPHWIPCSERMPEEREWLGTKRFGTTISDEVYVTFENPKGERFCKHLSFQNGKLSAYDQSTIDAFYKGSKPIAWTPQPEPWKGEVTE